MKPKQASPSSRSISLAGRSWVAKAHRPWPSANIQGSNCHLNWARRAFHVSEFQWPVGYCRWWWRVTTGKEEATISSKLTWSKLMVAVKALEAILNQHKEMYGRTGSQSLEVIRWLMASQRSSYRTHTTCARSSANSQLRSMQLWGERQSARYNEGLHLPQAQNGRDLHR